MGYIVQWHSTTSWLLKKRLRAVCKQERKVKNLEGERYAKLASPRSKKSQATNPLAGATWEQSISSEMIAVTEPVQTKNYAARAELDRLQE